MPINTLTVKNMNISSMIGETTSLVINNLEEQGIHIQHVCVDDTLNFVTPVVFQDTLIIDEDIIIMHVRKHDESPTNYDAVEVASLLTIQTVLNIRGNTKVDLNQLEAKMVLSIKEFNSTLQTVLIIKDIADYIRTNLEYEVKEVAMIGMGRNRINRSRKGVLMINAKLISEGLSYDIPGRREIREIGDELAKDIIENYTRSIK